MADQDKWTMQDVLEIRYWTDSLLSFKISRPAGYDFMPGHYSRLGLNQDLDANLAKAPISSETLVWRAFSIVSAPAESLLEYFGVIVPAGRFTSRLARLQPGDRIALENEVFGFMTPDRFTGGDALWMLATGTGLGPYISILRDAAIWRQFRHLVVVHCTRHQDELCYADELREMQVRNPDQLQVIHCVTREPENTVLSAGILQGRITSLLLDGRLEQAVGLPLQPETSRVMLCGNPAMIEEMRKLLHQRGMRPVRRALPGEFLTENYW